MTIEKIVNIALEKAVDREQENVEDGFRNDGVFGKEGYTLEDSFKLAKELVLERGYDDLNHRYDLFNEQYESEQYNEAKTYFESL